MHANHRIGVDTQRECRLRQTVPVWRVKPDVSDIDSIVRGYGRRSGMRAVFHPLYRSGGNVCVLSLYILYTRSSIRSGGVGSTHRAYALVSARRPRASPPPADRLRAVDWIGAYLDLSP